MRVCKYPDCSHTAKHNIGCKLHKFPIARDVCLLWLGACGFTQTPSKIPNEFYLCSCHFNNGEGPSKLCPIPERMGALDNDSEDEDSNIFNSGGLCSNCSTLIKTSNSEVFSKSCQTPLASKDNGDLNNENVLPVPTESRKVRVYDHEDKNVFVDISLDSDLNSPYTVENRNSPEGNFPRPSSISSEDLNRMCMVNTPPNSSIAMEEESLPPQVNGQAAESEVSPLVSNLIDRAAPPEDKEVNAQNSHEQPPTNEVVSKQEPPRKRRRRALFQPTDHQENSSGEKTYRSVGIQCSRPMLSYEWCRTNMTEKDFEFFTSLKKEAFEVLYEFLGGNEVCSRLKYDFADKTPQRERESEHTPRDELLMTLIRLRRGLPLRDLGFVVHLSEPTVSTIFYTWIRLVSKEFRTLQRACFVSSSVQNINPPDCYKPFPNLRCIVDCVEFKVQSPENFNHQNHLFSKYKSSCTAKVLIATSVYGGLSFISNAAEGCISDRRLLMKSGLLNYVTAGESIMVDKGFDVQADLNELGIDILIPAYSEKRRNFTPRELLMNKAIAASRIHVERFIKMLRDYRLIRWQIPNTLLDICSDIICVCGYLVNFHEPFVRWNDTEDETRDGPRTQAV